MVKNSPFQHQYNYPIKLKTNPRLNPEPKNPPLSIQIS